MGKKKKHKLKQLSKKRTRESLKELFIDNRWPIEYQAMFGPVTRWFPTPKALLDNLSWPGKEANNEPGKPSTDDN